MYFDLIIYFLILFAVVLIGILRYKSLTSPFKVLVAVVFVILLSELCARLLAYLIKNSNPTYHILCILQYIGFSIIYSNLLSGQKLKRLILFSSIPFIILSFLNTLFFQRFLTFPSNLIMLSYIIFVVFALKLFLQMLDAPKELAIFKQSVFWFNCAILVYSIIMPVCFGVLNYLIKHQLSTDILANFIEYFTFLYYSTLGYAILIDTKAVGYSS